MLFNEERIGNFTSSEIYRLVGKGVKKDSLSKPALTYIEEKRMERRLGRPLGTESNARQLRWGQAMEPYANMLNGKDVIYSSSDTHVHPFYSFWSGSRDYQRGENTVGDYKCPYTLKSFVQLIQPLYDGLDGIDAMNWIRTNHMDGEKYYWQLVSNGCIGDFTHAELCVFMPYKDQLDDIKEDIEGIPEYDFMRWAIEGELPYLIEGGEFQNINTIRFEIPQEDKDLLESKVKQAGELLLK